MSGALGKQLRTHLGRMFYSLLNPFFLLIIFKCEAIPVCEKCRMNKLCYKLFIPLF